jgi:hypothetical protein
MSSDQHAGDNACGEPHGKQRRPCPVNSTQATMRAVDLIVSKDDYVYAEWRTRQCVHHSNQPPSSHSGRQCPLNSTQATMRAVDLMVSQDDYVYAEWRTRQCVHHSNKPRVPTADGNVLQITRKRRCLDVRSLKRQIDRTAPLCQRQRACG